MQTDAAVAVALAPENPSTPDPTRSPTIRSCLGDCNHDGLVSVAELVKGTDIALGRDSLDACDAYDFNDDQKVSVDELLRGVTDSLRGCEASATCWQ